MKRTIVLLPIAMLAACGSADTDPGPGDVTTGEAKALDEAAEMLEQRRLPPEALRTGEPEGGTEPEADAAGD